MKSSTRIVDNRRPPAVKKALRHPDKLGAGASKRRNLSPKDKAHTIGAEFQRGTLRSGSGKKVTSEAQKRAIIVSEAYPESRKRKA